MRFLFLKLSVAHLILALCCSSTRLVHAQESPGVTAEDDSVFTYGELVVAQNLSEQLGRSWLDLSWGVEGSDPLLDTQSLSLSYRYIVTEYFFAGLLYKKYFSEKSPLLQLIEQDLDLLGVDINAERPNESYYVILGAIPLSGKLNFFALKTLPVFLSLSVGIGERLTREGNKYLGYIAAFESSLMLTQKWGVSLRYERESEAAFQSRKTIHRDQLNLGLLLRF